MTVDGVEVVYRLRARVHASEALQYTRPNKIM